MYKGELNSKLSLPASLKPQWIILTLHYNSVYLIFQVLAEEAHPLENLDRAAAQESLNKAQSELNSAANDKVGA